MRESRLVRGRQGRALNYLGQKGFPKVWGSVHIPLLSKCASSPGAMGQGCVLLSLPRLTACDFKLPLPGWFGEGEFGLWVQLDPSLNPRSTTNQLCGLASLNFPEAQFSHLYNGGKLATISSSCCQHEVSC